MENMHTDVWVQKVKYLDKCDWFCVKIYCVKGCAAPSSIINMNHSSLFL